MQKTSSYLQQSQTIIRVDEKGNSIGAIDKWEAHEKGILHKGFSVALWYKHQIILQVRKHPVFDKVVDLTASSHPLVLRETNQPEEEAVYGCLLREWNITKEEIKDFQSIGSFLYNAADHAGYIEHEYCTFYRGSIDRMIFPILEFAHGYISVDPEYLKTNPHLFNLAPWVKEGLVLL